MKLLLKPARVAGLLALLGALTASAQDATCSVEKVPLERRLRQVYLDLLGRPPTIDEYKAAQNKGRIEPADVDALMKTEEFYARMKEYHRALLRSNVTASVYNNGDTRLQVTTDGAKPLEMRGNPASPLRGRNGIGCDHFIPQDDCKSPQNAQDPHAEPAPASKACRDVNGVPLPVSFDYDVATYQCSAIAGATSCTDAVSKGLLPDKYLYFCDMRRQASGALQPFRCMPDPTKPVTAALSVETLDAQGRVTAFSNPNPASGATNLLERCTLDLRIRNGVKGSYQVQTGCIQREGWVLANAPYWDMTAPQTAVCAIEAQDRAVNPATMTSCETAGFMSDRSCGCGKNFRRCESGNPALVHNVRVAAVNEEPLLITDQVLRSDEDYFRILTTKKSFINGPLAALYREKQGIGVWAASTPLAADQLPKLSFADDPTRWEPYLRGENASGVLTTPAWLYRFPTQRSRVSQFYEAFLCRAFSPPADAVVPDPEDSCNRENNLAKRCGCNYCHATIEPTGAHWGRFGERNAQYLDPQLFPKFDAKCRDCALAGNTTCDNECGNYIMQAYDGDGANSLGMLKTYLYRTPEEEPNVTAGPALLVERMLQTGDLERCAVRRMWKEFVGRPMTTQEEGMYLQSLVDGFIADNHNLKKLIHRVMVTDAYGRID